MSDIPASAAEKTAGIDWPALAPALIGLACFGILTFALTAQYAFGYQPCELCTYQRFAYGMAGCWPSRRCCRNPGGSNATSPFC